MLALKAGVRLVGCIPQILFAATVVDQVYGSFLYNLTVITSAIDSKHLDGSGHYVGKALDFRTQDPGGAWAMDDAARAKVRAEISARLGDDFLVIDEGGDAANSTAPHIHVEFKPLHPLTP